MRKIIVLLFAGFMVLNWVPQQALAEKSVSISVHPNIELLSIVLSMTTWRSKMGPPDVPYEYAKDVEKQFSSFKSHKAVKLAQELRDKGFVYDAPPNFVLYFSAPPEFKKLYPYSEYLKGRAGGEKILDDFAEALRQFAIESNFMTFFEEHQEFYNRITESIKKDIDQERLVYDLEGFFGYEQGSYNIILAPYYFMSGGYGVRVGNKNRVHCYEIMRTSEVRQGLPYFGSPNGIYYLSLHEFAHSFVNPITEEFSQQVTQHNSLYNPVADKMKEMAYGNWETMLNETMIRAFTCYKKYEELGTSEGNGCLTRERERGFYFIVDIFELYLEYMQNRVEYPDFKKFYPVILDRLGKITYNEASKKSIPDINIKKDSDEDGLDDFNEFKIGTNPYNNDTDDDGLSDGEEVTKKTNPLNPDTDGDGLKDGEDPDPLNKEETKYTAPPASPVSSIPPPTTVGTSSSPTKGKETGISADYIIGFVILLVFFLKRLSS